MEMMLDEIRRPHRLLVSLPFPLARLMATFAQFVPGAPLTPDQVLLLRHDNIVGAQALGLLDLGVAPTLLGQVLPSYLQRYRPGGSLAFSS
jgi:NADH dehydrogenase